MTATATATTSQEVVASSSSARRIVPLLPGQLSCLACGIAVDVEDGTAPALEVQVSTREGVPIRSAVPATIAFARCGACRRLEERAKGLLFAHPGLTRSLGSVAAHQLTGALEAVAAIAPDTDPVPGPDEAADALLMALVRHLRVPGLTARWMTRFAPVPAADASLGTCARRPWSHLTPAERTALRQGWAEVLAYRSALARPPVAIAPPPIPPTASSAGADIEVIDGGCLLCGRNAVRVSATQALSITPSELWTPLTVPYRAFRLRGHLCPTCEDLRSSGAVGGSWGPTHWEAAYLAALDASEDPTDHEQARRLRDETTDGRYHAVPPFAVLVADRRRTHRAVPTPSAKPFAHLSSPASG